MNEQLNKLYDRIYKGDLMKDPEKFIQLIEPELSLIDSTEYSDRSDNDKATKLIADYGVMLLKAGYLKKSQSYLEKAIKRIEDDNEIKNIWNEQLYESLIFNRGVAQLRLKNKNYAKKDFKNLISQFPENGLYAQWLNYSNDSYYAFGEWILKGISLIGFLFLVIYYQKNHDEKLLLIIAVICGIIGCIGAYGVHRIRKNRIRPR